MTGLRERICKIEDCYEPHRSKGYCAFHYQRHLSGIAMDSRRFMPTDGPCLMDGCESPRRCRGLCTSHYNKALRHAVCPICGGDRHKYGVLCVTCFRAALSAHVPTEKACRQCERVLPVDAFNFRKSGAGSVKWRADCKECQLADQRLRAKNAHRDRSKEKLSAPYLNLRRYAKELGIPWAEVVERYPADNRCEICRRTPQEANPGGRFVRLALDHCHETGALRGFLCGPCNTGLGILGDRPERVQAALGYLLSHYPAPVRKTGRRRKPAVPQDALFDLPAA